MRWFNFLNKKEYPKSEDEVLTELSELETKREEMQAELSEAKADLDTKKIEFFAGEISKTALNKAKTRYEEAADAIGSIDAALEGMRTVHGDFLKEKKNDRIAEIKAELKKLEEEKESMRDEILTRAGKLSALLYIYNGTKPQYPFPIPRREAGLFDAEYEKVMNGRHIREVGFQNRRQRLTDELYKLQHGEDRLPGLKIQ